MKRTVTSIAAAALIIFGLSLPSLPAQAKVPDMPNNVATWFEDDAPGIIARLSSPSPDIPADPDGLTPFPYGSTIGVPKAVMVWGDAFMKAARPTTDMLTPRGDWIAPILWQGKPVGTLIADPPKTGPMGWCADLNPDTANGLTTARSTDVIADDGQSGLFVLSGSTARQYGLANRGIEPVPGTLQQLQGAILDYRAQMKAANDAAGEVLTGAPPLAFDQYIRNHPSTATASSWPVIVLVATVLAVLGATGGLLVRRQAIVH